MNDYYPHMAPRFGNANHTLTPRRTRLGMAIVLAAGMVGGGPAWAEGQQARGGTLEEVVVTARRRSEVATDVPMAITAMSSEYLADQGVTSVEILNDKVPGLNVSQGTTGPNLPLVSLRGQRPSEVLLTMDPAVPMYFADVVLTPVHGSNLAMYDLADVQVLKGPQGTLFGRNSTGGVVLLTPKAPEQEFGGFIKGTLGNYDLYKVEGGVSLPVNDVLSFRIAGQKTERDGYQSIVDNGIPAGEVGSTAGLACDDCLWDEDSEGIRVLMSVDTGDFRNLTTVSYDKNDSIGKAQVITDFNDSSQLGALYSGVFNGALGSFPLTPNAPSYTRIDDTLKRSQNRSVHDVEADFIPRDEVENTFFANSTEFDVSDDLTVKNIFGYRKVETLSSLDNDGTALPLFGAISVDSATLPAGTSVPSAKTISGEQFSNEIQLLGSAFDERLQWLGGVYYYKMQASERFLSSNFGRNPDFDNVAFTGVTPIDTVIAFGRFGLYQSSSNADVENTAYAVFGEATYDFTDDLSVTLGLRQSWDKRELTSRNVGLVGSPALPPGCVVLDSDDNPVGPDCARTEDETYSSPTWRIAANYALAETQSVYGSISTGYRTGGFQTRAKNNITFEPFDEETVLVYEIGHKADWELGWLGNARTSAAYYYQDYDDIQKTQSISNASGGLETVIQNAGKAVVQGVDLDVTVAPTENFSMTMGYAYIDAYYKEWETELFDNKDSPFVYIPEHSVFASANYTLPLDAALGDITLIAGVYYQSKVDTFQQYQHLNVLVPDPAEAAEAKENSIIPSYTLWNFRLNWRSVMGSDFDFSAYVNNAFDKEYAVGSTPVIDSLGLDTKSYGPPRTFGASLQWNF